MDKNFGRYRLLIAMVVCMLMCTACKREGYNTDSLKEVNVLTTETALEGGGNNQEKEAYQATGAITVVEEGDIETTTGGNITNLDYIGGDSSDENAENTTGGDVNTGNAENITGGDVNDGNANNNQEGGDAPDGYDAAAGDYDMTLEEAMDMREEVDGEIEDIQWTDIEEEYQETGGDNQITYEDIDTSPSPELEQAFDDIINGEYEGEEGPVTVGSGSMNRE